MTTEEKTRTLSKVEKDLLAWEKMKVTINKDFMKNLFSIAEKYQIFDEDDIALLTSTNECKRVFDKLVELF